MTDPQLRVLSLGAGVQSTTMALMAAHGELTPMPDCAIFADTQWEPRAVYEHLDWLRSPNVLPFPVHIVTAGNIREDIIARRNADGGRFASVPWFTDEITSAGSEVPVFDQNELGDLVQVGARTLTQDEHKHGIGRRQCTSDYKLKPLMHKMRELLGVSRRGYIAPGAVEVWVGISMDEIIRMKPARQQWQKTRWPLIEECVTRQQCIQWLTEHGYPIPPKSACIGCPFHNNTMWRDMRDHSPDEWLDAIVVDRALRQGSQGPMRSIEYMHADRIPLDEVDLTTLEDRGQINLFNNECEGMCGL